MVEHHADLSGVLVRAGRPNWKALSKEFAAAGLTDINGNPPTDAVSRNTWVKVRALVAKEGVPTTRPRRERPSATVANLGRGRPDPVAPWAGQSHDPACVGQRAPGLHVSHTHHPQTPKG